MAHSHEHHHGHHHAVGEEPRFSLLQLSVLQRLAGAGVVIVALWAAVIWALS